MKLKFKIMGFAVLIATCAALFSAFNATDEAVKVIEQPDGVLTVKFDPKGREDVIAKVFTHDTITTTQKDTLNLGYILASPYQYSYQLKIAKISGTPSLKVVLDTRNSLSNTDWMAIDSISAAGADSTKTYFILTGANTYGLQHRLRIVGTTGVNQYDFTALLKKTL